MNEAILSQEELTKVTEAPTSLYNQKTLNLEIPEFTDYRLVEKLAKEVETYIMQCLRINKDADVKVLCQQMPQISIGEENENEWDVFFKYRLLVIKDSLHYKYYINGYIENGYCRDEYFGRIAYSIEKCMVDYMPVSIFWGRLALWEKPRFVCK